MTKFTHVTKFKCKRAHNSEHVLTNQEKYRQNSLTKDEMTLEIIEVTFIVCDMPLKIS